MSHERAYKKMQEEIAELETPQARYQAILDRWVGEQRAAEAEARRIRKQLDPFNLGLYD
jgi:hypothetical protein